ncbi:MAG TPA: hypothetical protein QGF05_01470 [Dehalococcoidia bacterium]|nr:hypothetical protein [Dehalococcoidia bacterium]
MHEAGITQCRDELARELPFLFDGGDTTTDEIVEASGDLDRIRR